MSGYSVGRIAVHVVPEQELDRGAGVWLFPDLVPDAAPHPELVPDHIDHDGALRLDSHTFAFTVDGRRIVVDTGVGNGKTRANPFWHDLDTPYLDELAAAGFAREAVSLVVITHLHTDHVGWNTRRVGGVWEPTFPHARYLTADVEWRYWRSVHLEPERRRMFDDSILPIDEAGLLDTVDVGPEGHEIAAGVRLVPAPGHTPGQVVVELRDGGDAAVISGDALHHPIQVTRPELVTRADIDAEGAVATRRELLARVAGRGSLLLGTHFTSPPGGRVVRDGEGHRFVPEPVTPVDGL